jgi:aryl-alcohol dehydrogenase-like predicted oxidoreductase
MVSVFPTPAPTRPLGASGVDVPAIGVGTNRWTIGGPSEPALEETYKTIVAGGAAFLDTAEIYGFGKSEQAIGRCIEGLTGPVGGPPVVVSKFAPFIARTSSRQLLMALDKSLARLKLQRLDLYLVHWPFPFADFRDFAAGLAEAVKSGKARAVGVSNFNASQMRQIADLLAKQGVPLAANEVHYSLLHRQPEAGGVLTACRELDAALVAYFPLASGRFARPPEAGRPDPIAALRVIAAEIAQDHQATTAEVALNWLLARDPHVIPIPGATKAAHAEANLKALTWSLTEAEFARLDQAAPIAG